MPIKATRTGIVLRPDPARVLYRPFDLGNSNRILKIIARVSSLTDDEVEVKLEEVIREFGGRHYRLERFFLNRFEQVKEHLLTDEPLLMERKLLLGAYFTMEYSLESAALFNPSMIWHPDQTNLPAGYKRFILSLRATGEGHISSISFRTGYVDKEGDIVLQKPSRHVTSPELIVSQQFKKDIFVKKLYELRLINSISEGILAGLSDEFTLPDLEAQVKRVMSQFRHNAEYDTITSGLLALARSNYEMHFDDDQSLDERCIFPYSPNETNGIEDARFVEFCDDDGKITYYATYTAYNGRVTFPQLLETTDFTHFSASTLNGAEVQNKGMALFPRKINGRYATLSRQDGENVYLMYSDDLYFWQTKELIAKPTYPWEYVQLGNCGSPIETEAGWLVLTHGVGPMRKYAIGAFLLDLNDPSKVIGRMSEPLLSPDANEREGYVPNVVYSCGGQVYQNKLIIPYAMSDYASSFATVNLDELLAELKAGQVVPQTVLNEVN
ncbi:glycoside hydrolase family 130 protein [Fibrella sp. HMF5335]|uniref:Glycoside hydrolase family 130 protein n=1 Tax=Fibrella rubiginis TaxID=2817060 RepID=A0A939K6K5_9BACT|nr:glycoside hydrolase family 130 protein [Fibrella rubiginis]MBO0938933.1 glycoside hydrolase family 130 protein [Fibrella rubiginis]